MRRWLTRILVCLVLGAVSTITVAWTLALTMPKVGSAESWVTPVRTETPHWAVGAARSLGALDIGAVANSELDWSPDIDEFQVPGWSRAAHPPTTAEVEGFIFCYEHARGWPMLALYWRDTYSSASQPPDWRTEWGWEIDFAGRFAKSRALPLAVIWPGFFIDTLLYGTLWLGLIFGPGAARRGLRRKRGRCPMCAYDLRGGLESGCPECGWGREEDES